MNENQYNPDEKSTHLQYLDANNLFGWAITKELPTHGFAWEKVEDFTPKKIHKQLPRKNHNKLSILVKIIKSEM